MPPIIQPNEVVWTSRAERMRSHHSPVVLLLPGMLRVPSLPPRSGFIEPCLPAAERPPSGRAVLRSLSLHLPWKRLSEALGPPLPNGI